MGITEKVGRLSGFFCFPGRSRSGAMFFWQAFWLSA
jgi:hypothetical protein